MAATSFAGSAVLAIEDALSLLLSSLPPSLSSFPDLLSLSTVEVEENKVSSSRSTRRHVLPSASWLDCASVEGADWSTSRMGASVSLALVVSVLIVLTPSSLASSSLATLAPPVLLSLTTVDSSLESVSVAVTEVDMTDVAIDVPMESSSPVRFLYFRTGWVGSSAAVSAPVPLMLLLPMSSSSSASSVFPSLWAAKATTLLRMLSSLTSDPDHDRLDSWDGSELAVDALTSPLLI
mmetsp:Transcript_34338/g.69319  ORF Transcript_34338/g.69319 Transcript_34338/m.69319 type:complete len:236 (+) Transcript_34338:164-871(+)